MALRYLYLYDHGQLQVMLKPSKCGISRTPITVTTKMMIPCSSILSTHSFTKKPRHFSGATPIPSGSAIAKAPVIHAASQVSSRQLGNANATRLMSRCATGVTDVSGATMLPGQVIGESLGSGYPLVN